ncbi:TraM recognition domain-containing protein [Paraburkholderia sp. UCT31]|uniref:type IV secretory system conjugative DNA transfer family protein n=1 Tax=Paraburkholderia sp. UCT31 TaxID=2615209 RepID=UPI001655472C|nr:TraM recognition domain-containing protein [Paraburkholderia sp. UCT31]MBC8738530.1 TraM recognition domain-containing protein [Paraburkholderia sp. UCT31]
MLIGRKDAMALLGFGAGIAASSPWLAGNPLALAGLAGPFAGASWLAYKATREWLDRTDTESRENFILPSDETYGELMHTQKGLRFGYTRDNALPVDIEDGFLQRHTAIIGQSGVGKTTLGEFLLWQQISRGGGFIFIDAKLDAETRDKLGLMMAVAGRSSELYVLNVDKPENSNTYNPLLQGDPDEVASRLLNLLPSADNNPGADYYRQSTNYALTVIMGALQAAKKRFHFSDITILLQSGRALAEIERMIPAGTPQRMAFQLFLDQFRKKGKEGVQIDIDRVKQVLGGMAGRMATFAQGKFGKVFNTYTPEIDLTDIVLNNKCLYVMLPTMGKDTAALNLGKMILSDLRTAVYNVQGLKKIYRPSPPFLVFADEMGSYVMPGIARLFEQARSANICMVPAFQSFANLSVVSPDFADIIIQNTWNKVFFKFASKDSPEQAAEIIGKSKKYVYSMSVSENEGESSQNTRTTPQANASKGGGMSESFRASEEFRVTPDHLKSIGMGEAFVMSGPRIYHIKTPMLLYPEPVPEYHVLRRKIEMQPGEEGLNFEERYKEFLMSVEEEARLPANAPSEPRGE